ncbi:MAG: hypothetical protein JNL28_17540 [Planctomycetes bacterium]|nr:hypothetical protein [Planctomycetota bacterium]
MTLAENFLREAVFRSRAAQAAASAFPAPASARDTGRCGLGERAAVVLDLSDKGREIFAQIFSVELEPEQLEQIQAVMREWITAQDALDRKRNHFLKAFRAAHGFDRTRYTAAQVTEYDAGLARVNDAENEARRAAAAELLALARRP